MWQQVTVYCIVAAAALHATRKYSPAGWRRKIVEFLTRRGARQSSMAAWFNIKPGCGDGCSSCNSCSSEPAPSELPPPEPAPKRVIKLHAPPRQ